MTRENGAAARYEEAHYGDDDRHDGPGARCGGPGRPNDDLRARLWGAYGGHQEARQASAGQEYLQMGSTDEEGGT